MLLRDSDFVQSILNNNSAVADTVKLRRKANVILHQNHGNIFENLVQYFLHLCNYRVLDKANVIFGLCVISIKNEIYVLFFQW